MQALITLALVSLWIASPLWAGTITFNFGAERIRTTTAAQDARLAAFVARLNIERAAQTPPLAAISIEQYLEALLVEAVGTATRQADERDAVDACATYRGLSAGARNTINTSLGGKSPCP